VVRDRGIHVRKLTSPIFSFVQVVQYYAAISATTELLFFFLPATVSKTVLLDSAV